MLEMIPEKIPFRRTVNEIYYNLGVEIFDIDVEGDASSLSAKYERHLSRINDSLRLLKYWKLTETEINSVADFVSHILNIFNKVYLNATQSDLLLFFSGIGLTGIKKIHSANLLGKKNNELFPGLDMFTFLSLLVHMSRLNKNVGLKYGKLLEIMVNKKKYYLDEMIDAIFHSLDRRIFLTDYTWVQYKKYTYFGDISPNRSEEERHKSNLKFLESWIDLMYMIQYEIMITAGTITAFWDKSHRLQLGGEDGFETFHLLFINSELKEFINKTINLKTRLNTSLSTKLFKKVEHEYLLILLYDKNDVLKEGLVFTSLTPLKITLDAEYVANLLVNYISDIRFKSIYIIHNHPSGVNYVSSDDIKFGLNLERLLEEKTEKKVQLSDFILYAGRTISSYENVFAKIRNKFNNENISTELIDKVVEESVDNAMIKELNLVDSRESNRRGSLEMALRFILNKIKNPWGLEIEEIFDFAEYFSDVAILKEKSNDTASFENGIFTISENILEKSLSKIIDELEKIIDDLISSWTIRKTLMIK